MELRGYATQQKDTKIVGELVDVNVGGNMLLFSFLIGWEPR